MIKKILLILLILNLSLNTPCDDGTTCPGNQKCCATKDGISCCPYVNGVCCTDMKHCCPSGHKCTSKGTCLVENQGKKIDPTHHVLDEDELPILPYIYHNN